MFYVYIYLDPRKLGKYIYGEYKFDYEPFYVGKGKNGQWKKINGRTEYFKKIIKKIERYGLIPIVIKLKENIINEDDSFNLEKQLIKLIGRKDLSKGSLVNFTDGGEGCSGWICSEETKKKHSELMIGKNNSMFGKSHSEESNRKHSETKKELFRTGKLNFKGKNHPMFGKHRSESWKKKQSDRTKGENHPQSILTEKDIIKIRIDLREGKLFQREIGEKFGVSQSAVSMIKNNKRWRI